MSFEAKEIVNKEAWENLLSACPEKTFLQSWNWGEFQKQEGNKIWRLAVGDDQNLVAAAQIVKISARRGIFLSVPHGPVALPRADKKAALEILTHRFIELARNEGAAFIRLAPVWPLNPENMGLFKYFKFRDSPIHMHAEVTWELDITPSEETIMANMRKTTRYLIRQAQKNPEIEVAQSRNVEDLKNFLSVYEETVRRHIFVPFSLEYLQKEFLAFFPDGQISIFLGKYQGKVVASAIVVYWQNMGFYHHGASSQRYAKIPVSYLVQWEAILEAKKRGCELYNFWGIAPEISEKSDIARSKHPWAGLTLFKMGFGGYRKEYVKTQDFPLSNRYWLTYFFEKIRRIKRGL